jgi:hypothetical protein
MKLESIMGSYGLDTFGEAVTFCVNKLFEKDSEVEQTTTVEQNPRDVEEIEFLRKLALTMAENQSTINVTGAGGGGGQTVNNQTPAKEERSIISDAEIERLKDSVRDDMDSSVEELKVIYENGEAKPSQILEICEPEHSKSDVESLEEYKKRKEERRSEAKSGTLKPEHPSGLAPPP